MSWKQKYGKWALITGASSGIGRAFALELTKKGMDVILTSSRKDKLEKVATECAAKNPLSSICIYPVEMTHQGSGQKLIELIGDKEIGILVNNVGIVANGEFAEIDLQRQLNMLTLHCAIPLVLTNHYLKEMLSRDRGAIINIASLAAYYYQPSLTTYSATKSFLLRFSNSLYRELLRTGVDVLAVVPGLTKTEAFKSADWDVDFESLPFFFRHREPQEVSKRSLELLGKRNSIVIASLAERIINNAYKLLPNNVMDPFLEKMLA